jgi:glycosyltransferase involved in cell wall biosynthesis
MVVGSMMPRISIIVPVYNTMSYLETCIDSILTQSFTDFELLLVDDGSTDGSGIICDVYANKDNRISVYHKDNGGVSSARNLGLDNAGGEWIYFVDSDDELFPGGLQSLVDGICDDVDIIGGGYERFGPNGEILEIINERRSITLSKEDTLLTISNNRPFYYSYLGYMWMWMFRSSIIQSHHLRFDYTIKIKEDTLFLVQYVCASNGRTCFNTAPVYKYKVRDESAMSSLAKRYCSEYQTSFDAVVQIHSAIHALPEIGQELSEVTNKGVLDRVHMIYAHMLRFHAVDSGLVASMKRRAVKAVGLPFYLQYEYRRNRRRVRKLVNRLFKKQ